MPEHASAFHKLLAWLRARINLEIAGRPPGETAFLLLIPLTGVLVGLSALAISHLIELGQSLFWGGASLLSAALEAPWWKKILVPALGGALVGACRWALRIAGGSQGTAGILHALALKGGEIPLLRTLPRVAVGILTVASGGSLGREGPIISMAASMGSALGQRFGLPASTLRILVCCAAASAIAAVYNAPIAGTMFAMEILIGSFALEVFGPLVIASVISTLIFRMQLGNLPRFVLPAYEMVSAWEMLAYAGLGVLAGVCSRLFTRTIFLLEDFFAARIRPAPLRPALGFAVLGLLGCLLPQVYGNGYEPTNLVLHDQMPLRLLPLLLLAKLASTAITAGSGGLGGLITPSMMLGALLGSLCGSGLQALFAAGVADPGAYALVGMGGILAGTTQAPITAVLMIFEQTNSYPIILPLMLVCIVSSITARVLGGKPQHEEQLRRQGIELPSSREAGVMQGTRVADVMHERIEAIEVTAPFRKVVEWFLGSSASNLHVVDRQGRFVGAIQLHAIKGALHYAESLSVVLAYDLVNPSFEFVVPSQTLAETMEIFWRQPCERLPVVDGPDTRKLVGWVSKRDIIGIYRQEILRRRNLTARFSLENQEPETT